MKFHSNLFLPLNNRPQILLFFLLQKKKRTKQTSSTIKPSKVLLSQSQNSRFSQLLSRGQPVPKEREKENKKKKKEKKKNDDEERDACLANN